MKTRTISRLSLAAVALTGTLAMTPAHAIVSVPEEVSATYQGIIMNDDGLGLVGETMTVAFTYDATTPNTGGYFFNPFTAMTVSIGANTWTFAAPGSSYVSLTNDGLESIAAGIEDIWIASAGEFTGPSLTAEIAQGHGLEMYFYDNVPGGAPDGLSDDAALPSIAPNPGLFTSTRDTVMVFSFYTGDIELGDHYHIIANDIQQVAAVPEPETYAMWLAGIGLLGAIARRRH